MVYLRYVSLGKFVPIMQSCQFQHSVYNRISTLFRMTSYTLAKRQLYKKPDLPIAEEKLSSADFKVIYRFPYIRFVRFITRIKLYQTGLTVFAIPPTVYAYASGIVGLNSCMATVSVGLFASVMLIIMSNFLQRFIGLLAVSDSLLVARLSHLTFFGKRRDVFVPCEDIVPWSDVSENANDMYLKVRRYSNPQDVYFLSLRFGHIENMRELQKLFGSLSNQ